MPCLIFFDLLYWLLSCINGHDVIFYNLDEMLSDDVDGSGLKRTHMIKPMLFLIATYILILNVQKRIQCKVNFCMLEAPETVHTGPHHEVQL